jgi:hypothetical protein
MCTATVERNWNLRHRALRSRERYRRLVREEPPHLTNAVPVENRYHSSTPGRALCRITVFAIQGKNFDCTTQDLKEQQVILSPRRRICAQVDDETA